MDDLRARFESLDRVEVPDVWSDVERRLRASGPAPVARPVLGAVTRGRSAPRPSAWWLLAAALIGMALVAGALAAAGNRDHVPVRPPAAVTAPIPATTPAPSAPSAPSPTPSLAQGDAGSRLAYTAQGELFTASADGTDVRPLSVGNGYAMFPRWSPDGTRIAFVLVACPDRAACEYKGEPATVVVMRPDGSERHDVARVRYVMALAWSPDGTTLAFTADSAPGIQLVAADGTKRRSIVVDSVLLGWSPDGAAIAYAADDGTHLVAPDGSGDRLLLDPTGEGIAIAPRWAPDGTQIAFAWYGESGILNRHTSDAWVVAADGTNPRRMSEVPHGATFEGWSPDGRLVAWLDTSTRNPEHRWPLVVANRDGSNPQPIGTVESARVDWSPDGTRLFVVQTDGVLILDPRGVALPVQIQASDASWQPAP